MQMTIQRRYVRYYLPGLKGQNGTFTTVLLQPTQGGGRHGRKGGRHESGTVAPMRPEPWLPRSGIRTMFNTVISR